MKTSKNDAARKAKNNNNERNLKRQIKRLKCQNDKLMKENKDLKRERKETAAAQKKTARVSAAVEKSQKKVPGHSYSKLHADLAVKIRNNTSCGSRDVVKILEIINEEFGGILDDEIPCANTIDNWENKCGLDAFNEGAYSLDGAPYAMIVDDSMMVGGQRLLLVLLALAAHDGKPLTHHSVILGGMFVAKSFDSESVKEALQETAEKVGHDPEYVISDNASIMVKGTRLAGFRHHSDITHTLGMFLERAYKKEPDFCHYVKQMTEVSFKCNMLPIAYLLPPKQRTIARFINMDNWVQWSIRMASIVSWLPQEQRESFSFVPQNASLIDELYEVMSCVRYVEKTCKHEGLSTDTARKCEARVNAVLMAGNERMRGIGTAIKDFLRKETEWIGTAKHNCSSDIIESTFGIYKNKKSPNKMYGVTPLVLRLALCGKMGNEEYDVAQSLTAVKMRDIEDWKAKNLLPNLVSKRLRILSKVA